MTEPTLHNPLGYEKIGKLIARFSIPCVISMLVNALYNIVDQIFIGWGVGFLGNAATNVSFPFVTIALAFALLIGDGGAAFYSLKLGEKDKETAAKGVGNCMILLLAAGLVFVALGFGFLRPLLHIFGATDEIMPYAVDYTRIILVGLPFVIMATGLNSTIRADGSPNYSMAAMLSGAILNTILDPIFIFVFHMGVKGAALATVIGQVVSFVFALFYLKRFKCISFHAGLLRLKGSVAGKIAALGTSSFITQIAMALVMTVMNNSLRYYGAQSAFGSEVPLAALGIVMKVNMILMSVIIGISVGSQPIIGFNYGAQNYHRVKKTYLTAAGIAVGVAFCGFLCFMLFPQAIVGLFGQENALYNEFAVKCFRIFLMFCVLNGFQVITSIYFQAVGKPVRATMLSLSRQVFFFIPAVLILPRMFGLMGTLYAGPVADGLAFLLAAVFSIIELRHLTRMEASNQPIPEELEPKLSE